MVEQRHTAWGIVREHLAGAEFAMARFEAALSHPSLTMAAVGRGPEAQLLGHVDGLVVGGHAVVDELLLPELDAEKPPALHRGTAIVLTLLQARRAELATRTLGHPAPEVRRAARRACALGAGASLDAWIAQGLHVGGSSTPRAALLELAADRGLRVPSLGALLQTDDADELIPALRLAWTTDPSLHELRVVALLEHRDPGVRDGAMVTLLHYGSSYGFSACAARANDAVAVHPLAMALYAGLGGPSHHESLVAMSRTVVHREGAIRALGFSGNVEVVPCLLEHARSADLSVARLAVEALATLLGEPIVGEHDLRNFIADAGRGAASYAALSARWADARPRFDAKRRYLAGLPATPTTFVTALLQFPMRRRFIVALLLSVRTRGTARVATRAFSATQRAQIAAVTPVAPAGLDDPWARALGSP